jgi:hypothetical protein
LPAWLGTVPALASAYLYEFEQNLQDFDRDIMLPYWDWTMPQYRPEQPEKGWIIPQAFKAYLTEAAAETLIGALDPSRPGRRPRDSKRWQKSRRCSSRRTTSSVM